MEKAPAHLEIVLQYFADFTPRQLEQLTALEELYTGWNKKINVISRKDIDGLYEKHVLHSLAIAAVFDFPPGMEVIDIGTGGGFPGIPLAIFFPETKFHLVDSIGKKLKVIEAVREATGLTNVSTWHGRAEEIKDRKFDVAVSRAVAPLKELWTWAKPLLRKPPRTRPSDEPGSPAIARPSGLICLKGGDLGAEISGSGLRPRMIEIYDIFPLESFRDKYLLHAPY
ncbi:MAG TPA: 16S rRNA (guanine(527)-N(7))-methyltransferase RsmG [Puia sp.]|jgi:16S rRNA (guanine527-N7)-methyltransferase|nr:16S rRNA (guanine(527)-N(7))-methyltransferase RsmG [Puia sp.]